jgi:hypothetical protein
MGKAVKSAVRISAGYEAVAGQSVDAVNFARLVVASIGVIAYSGIICQRYPSCKK